MPPVFHGVRASSRCCILLALAGAMGALIAPSTSRAADEAIKKKPLEWLGGYKQAALQAHKTNQLILAYFTSSDAGEWDRKLEDDVLKTDAFRDWALQNVVLLRIDFPKYAYLSPQIKEQNDKLREKYNIAKVPTLLFLDPDGEIVARAGYDEAKMRDDEHQGHPNAWLKFCAEVLKNRPPDETIIEQKGIVEGMKYARKHYICLMLLVVKSNTPFFQRKQSDLLKNQPFVRFVNRNLAFVQMLWPDDSDQSPDAVAFRDFATRFKIGPAAIQLVFWDFGYDKVMAKITAWDNLDTDPMIETFTRVLPHADYGGAWLSDFRTGLSISSQQKKPLLVLFSDSGEYTQSFWTEIVKTEEFKDYSRKNLVLVKLDYPTTPAPPPPGSVPPPAAAPPATQPADDKSKAATDEKNRLADLYGIRGFPTIILLNSEGQNIGQAKYQKGGPVPFISELDQVIKNDKQRRTPGL